MAWLLVGLPVHAAVASSLVLPSNGAKAEPQLVNGFVVGITVIESGNGYPVAPLVLIRGGGGNGATAIAMITNGTVSSLKVTHPGIGYTNLPSVIIAAPPFDPQLAVEVSKVQVRMQGVQGRRYQLQSSSNAQAWSLAATNFTADSQSRTQEFTIAETGRYFRLIEVPDPVSPFPLSAPVRPTKFPLKRPARTGTVVAWGLSRATQVPLGLSNVVAISAGNDFTVALKSDGTVVGWGTLGNNQPFRLPNLPRDVVAISAGWDASSFALRANGMAIRFDGYGGVAPYQFIGDLVAIAAGGINSYANSALGLKGDGSLYLLQSNNRPSFIPVDNVVSMSGSLDRFIYLQANGRMTDSAVPSGLPSPTGTSAFVAVEAGATYGSVLKSDGTVLTWGNAPTLPLSLQGVIAIAAGNASHMLALKSNGTVVAWGYNGNGQTDVPVGLSNVIAISNGGTHSVALVSDGILSPGVASGTAQLVNGFVVGIDVDGGGRGYISPPEVRIRGGGGEGATASAVIKNGEVVDFTITNAGDGYTTAPDIIVAAPPLAPAVEIIPSRINVRINARMGHKYVIQSSPNLVAWSTLGVPFTPESESLDQELPLAEITTFFRLLEVL